MKVIIAGSRSITNQKVVDMAMEKISEKLPYISEIISGTAQGVDTLGENWGNTNSKKVLRFPAEWDNIENIPESQIKYTKYGKPYNPKAGHDRNQLMCDEADVLVLIWDGDSGGSWDMLKRAKQKGIPIFEFNSKKGFKVYNYEKFNN